MILPRQTFSTSLETSIRFRRGLHTALFLMYSDLRSILPHPACRDMCSREDYDPVTNIHG